METAGKVDAPDRGESDAAAGIAGETSEETASIDRSNLLSKQHKVSKRVLVSEGLPHRQRGFGKARLT